MGGFELFKSFKPVKRQERRPDETRQAFDEERTIRQAKDIKTRNRAPWAVLKKP